MKALLVYDENGNTIFSQSNASGNYYIKTQEIDNDKVIIGIDLETNSIITVDTFLSINDRNKKISELVKRNSDYLLTHKLEQLRKENEELNKDIKEELKRLKSANTEIIEYVNIVTGITAE